MTIRQLLVLLSVTLMLGGCMKAEESPRGFSLPKGDADAGKAVFQQYQCIACHTLDGIEQPDVEKDPRINLPLGGKTTRVKTYAELVTSVINPSHRFARSYPMGLYHEEGESKMRTYNEVLTVTELIDLVSFLQPQYELVPYTRTNYHFYDYKE